MLSLMLSVFFFFFESIYIPGVRPVVDRGRLGYIGAGLPKRLDL